MSFEQRRGDGLNVDVTSSPAPIWTSSEESVQYFIGQQLSKDPRIERVYATRIGRIINVWMVVAERPNVNEFRCIRNIEKDLIRRFGDMSFDFAVVYRNRSDPDSLISGAALVFDREQTK